MRKRKYTEAELREAVKQSTSMMGTLRYLGLCETGSGHYSLKNALSEWEIDTSHFTGRGWNRGLQVTCNPSKPIEEVLVLSDKYTSSHSLKLRLYKEGLKSPQCEICGLTTWLDKTISLHLDHIDGNRLDNRLNNLRILCPNCHSQTETFSNKTRPHKRTGIAVGLKHRAERRLGSNPSGATCIDCSKSISLRSLRCKSCAGIARSQTKIDWPCLNDLIGMVKATSYSAVGRQLGVSDNAVRKRIKAKS